MAKRVATYLRVRTKNHSQNLDTQRLSLEEYARPCCDRKSDVVPSSTHRSKQTTVSSVLKNRERAADSAMRPVKTGGRFTHPG